MTPDILTQAEQIATMALDSKYIGGDVDLHNKFVSTFVLNLISDYREAVNDI